MRIETFNGFDFSPFKLPLIVVLDSPSDYRELWVARLWDVDKVTDYFIIKYSLAEIRDNIPDGFHNLGRQPDDQPHIVEVWI